MRVKDLAAGSLFLQNDLFMVCRDRKMWAGQKIVLNLDTALLELRDNQELATPLRGEFRVTKRLEEIDYDALPLGQVFEYDHCGGYPRLYIKSVNACYELKDGDDFNALFWDKRVTPVEGAMHIESV